MPADIQGQAFPVRALAHLLGFELMPRIRIRIRIRIRNWKDLTFYRPAKQTEYLRIEPCSAKAAVTS
ncbi:Tn3 transposase DDE domain-containing protein [Streptomyces sp. yr375]|uniref:Tn3 family transposase n=1 Tax=Streptomyces sp. yr375 TaxID=1761906 RepID=UPI0008BC2589|nr:Tn3 family transposase [Streptomyces sp. yr375]SEP98332.1 Tn3 transposase DDE domain-containing protein [Streptomyces sp. yr375]